VACFTGRLLWLVGFAASSTGQAVEAKHNKATIASHHFRFLLFIAILPSSNVQPEVLRSGMYPKPVPSQILGDNLQLSFLGVPPS
jgi:hypothetical protein